MMGGTEPDTVYTDQTEFILDPLIDLLHITKQFENEPLMMTYYYDSKTGETKIFIHFKYHIKTVTLTGNNQIEMLRAILEAIE